MKVNLKFEKHSFEERINIVNASLKTNVKTFAIPFNKIIEKS